MAALRDGDGLVVNPRVTIPASDLSWSAARASGPGGQHVNKVATKVTLRFDLAATEALTSAQKARLRKIAGRRLGVDGAVSVSAHAERSQRQNLNRAREGLRRLILRALVAPKKRIPTKRSRASHERRIKHKRRQGEKKRSRARVHSDD